MKFLSRREEIGRHAASYYHRCRIEPNVVVVGLTMDFRSQDTRLDPILYICSVALFLQKPSKLKYLPLAA